MKLLDFDHPFFAPAWVRVAVVVVCAVWAVFEASQGAVLWAIVFGGIAAIAAWRFSTIDYSRYDETGG